MSLEALPGGSPLPQGSLGLPMSFPGLPKLYQATTVGLVLSICPDASIHFLLPSFLPTTVPAGLRLEAQLPQVSFLGLWESSVLIYLFQSSCKPCYSQQQ